MKKTKGLSPNQEQIMRILEYKKIRIITRNELLRIIKKYLKIKDYNNLIKKLIKKNQLKIIIRNIYLVIPFSSLNQNWTLDEYELIDYLLKDIKYYLGLYNALEINNITTQIPNKVFIFNTKYSFDKKILNYKFKLFKIKKTKFFGVNTDTKYPYSNKERTIIDLLEYYNYFGGLNYVFTIIKSMKFNKDILIDYALKYNSVKIMKLIGILTENNKLYKFLKNSKALIYYTTLKNTNNKLINKKWKIRLI